VGVWQVSVWESICVGKVSASAVGGGTIIILLGWLAFLAAKRAGRGITFK